MITEGSKRTGLLEYRGPNTAALQVKPYTLLTSVKVDRALLKV